MMALLISSSEGAWVVNDASIMLRYILPNILSPIIVLATLALPEAIATSKRWVQHDPLDEAACRSLMQAYSLAGDRSAALLAYQACKATLAAELDLAPDPATTLLAETTEQIVRERNAQGDHRVRYWYYSDEGMEYTGCHWHPSLADHELISSRLDDVIDTLPLRW